MPAQLALLRYAAMHARRRLEAECHQVGIPRAAQLLQPQRRPALRQLPPLELRHLSAVRPQAAHDIRDSLQGQGRPEVSHGQRAV